MRIRSLLIVAAIGSTLLVQAGCAAAAPKEEDVIGVLESFYGAMKTGDSATVMGHLAPDALFVEGGRLETRAEYEKNHLPLDIEFEKEVTGKRGPLRITVQGDTAWVIAVTTFDGTFQGAPINLDSAQLAVLTRETGNWLIRSIHWSSHRR